MVVVTYPVGPRTSIAPANPASPPDSAATLTSVPTKGTPAKAAARGFSPAALVSAPNTVRDCSTQTITTITTANTNPTCSRDRGTRSGNRNPAATGTDCGQPKAIGSFNGPSTISPTNSSTMKLSSSVVTTSSTPNLRRSKVGPINRMAPAAMLASINTATASGTGKPDTRLCPKPAVTSAPM